MKTIFLFAAAFILGPAYSQHLVFKINQSGVSHKNAATHRYDDAEIKNSEITIEVEGKVVKVTDETIRMYSLEKISSENNNDKHLYTQIWQGKDANNKVVQFRYTVNEETKEAIVEFGYKNYRNYYFGKYTDIEKADLPQTASASVKN